MVLYLIFFPSLSLSRLQIFPFSVRQIRWCQSLINKIFSLVQTHKNIILPKKTAHNFEIFRWEAKVNERIVASVLINVRTNENQQSNSLRRNFRYLFSHTEINIDLSFFFFALVRMPVKSALEKTISQKFITFHFLHSMCEFVTMKRKVSITETQKRTIKT